ncbi:hypothetical protein [Bacillus mojavensis]
MTVKYISVDNFVNSLKLPRAVSHAVLETTEDCRSFYSGFYGRNESALEDLLDYREKKLADSNVNINMFVQMCLDNDVEYALKKAFFTAITPNESIFITEAVRNGKVSLEEIYMFLKDDPNNNILRIML